MLECRRYLGMDACWSRSVRPLHPAGFHDAIRSSHAAGTLVWILPDWLWKVLRPGA
jgi:hypothetical protein